MSTEDRSTRVVWRSFGPVLPVVVCSSCGFASEPVSVVGVDPVAVGNRLALLGEEHESTCLGRELSVLDALEGVV